MAKTTEWGQHVEDVANSPRTHEPTYDGRPLKEVVDFVRAGGQLPGDPVDTSTANVPKPKPSLFDPAEQQNPDLFQQESGPVNSPGNAAQQAYIEAVATEDPGSFQQRKMRFMEGTIGDDALAALNDEQKRQSIQARFTQEDIDNMSPEEFQEAVQGELRRLNIREMSVATFGLISALAAGAGNLPETEFRAKYNQIPVSDLRARMNWMHRMNRRGGRIELEQAAAMSGFSTAEGIVDIALGDMTPIYPWLGRLQLVDQMEELAGVEPANFWEAMWLGSRRNRLQKHLASMTPEEFTKFGEDYKAMLDMWASDPSKSVNRYMLVELMETVFTEDVFDGISADNNMDVWMGNFETLVELTIAAAVVGKVAKGSHAVFTGTNSIKARNAARAGSARAAAKMDEIFQADELAVEMELLPDEVAPVLLPKPVSMIPHLDAVPEGTKQVVKRSERIGEEILESTEGLTGLGLTAADKTNAVNTALRQLDLIDHPAVIGRMSTLAMLEGDSGFKLRVVVGETAEDGYKSIEDAMDEVLNIDPQLEKVSIQRVNGDGVLEDVFPDAESFARAVTKGEVDASTAGRIAGGDVPDNRFYLVYEQERFWHPVDKQAFGAEAFQSGVLAPGSKWYLSPNARFGDEIYGSFLKAYMGEQGVIKNFELLFEPYYKLAADDKRFVASAFEWMEDFGKNNGRAPDIYEIKARYPDLSEAQLNGIVSLRTGMDTLHELFNRRLFREWQALDFKTARPEAPGLPNYHGKVLDEGVSVGTHLDPVTGALVRLTRKEAEVLYRDGGGVMELDIPIEVASDPRARATRVIIRPGEYRIGDLSTRPLTYHPGYSIRFYDDPYYIVKETEGVSLNGSLRNDASSMVAEAVRTAGTQGEAESWARRANRATQERGEPGVTFKVVRANDINQTESTLFQKQALNREGRLFWDERNFDRLPDVNGNLAELEDPVRALERGIGQAARQLTHEDLLRQVKETWKNEFGELIGDKRILDTFDLKEISGRLKAARRNNIGDKKQIIKAKELIDYIRLIEGSESMFIPALREQALNVAVAINSWAGFTGRGARFFEKKFMTMDPTQAMRSVAFNLFMVFRPVRQALLQSTQIGYLAALDPAYVAGPKLFTDAMALRRGLAALRIGGYDDGFSVKKFAQSMGISEKEYRVLIREFDRSGLLDLVDVHSFAGGSARWRKEALPPQESTAGTIGYRGRQMWRATQGFAQKWGFNFGERNNLTFTYNLALRRVMKRKGYDSLLQLSRKDWDDLKVEASNLSLGMVRPNNFGYQTGALGVATQFLSFSHKAALGILGQNPAISKAAALRILFGSTLLYGGNMYGARDFAEQQLQNIGVPDQTIPNTDISLVDLISAGIIDTTFNLLGELTVGQEEWKEVDLGFVAPGIDFPRLWDMQLRNIFSQPTKVALGPFGNIASNVLETYDIVQWIHNGQPDIPVTQKFLQSATVLGMATLPVFNDNVKAYFGYKMGLWYSAANEPLPLETTWNGILARGLVGARTREELAYYNLQRAWWEDQQDYQNAVSGTRKVIKQTISLFYDGVETRETVQRRLAGLINLYEDMPEGTRLQFLSDVMEGVGQNDAIVEQSVFGFIVEKALANKKFGSLVEIHNMVDQIDGIPDAQRQQLKQLLTDAHQGRIDVDMEAQEELENGRN